MRRRFQRKLLASSEKYGPRKLLVVSRRHNLNTTERDYANLDDRGNRPIIRQQDFLISASKNEEQTSVNRLLWCVTRDFFLNDRVYLTRNRIKG